MTRKVWIGWLLGLWLGIWVFPGWAMSPRLLSQTPVLSDWQAPETIADYRDQIHPLPSGYLHWQRFPVRVALQPVADSSNDAGTDAGTERDRQWLAAVRGAIADWQPYFPLLEVEAAVDSPEDWDIYILRSRPPAQRLRDGTILPARLADTRYEFLKSIADPQARLRFRIRIGTQQGAEGLRSTARHELGHALGLWGHSTNPQDVMYPAQTGLYPPISDRDLKTLQWLYNLTPD